MKFATRKNLKHHEKSNLNFRPCPRVEMYVYQKRNSTKFQWNFDLFLYQGVTLGKRLN